MKKANLLLEAAEELQKEEIQESLRITVVPEDKELWICCNDPDIDSILQNTLLPKGTQDKTKEFIQKINKARKLRHIQNHDIRQQQHQEYLDYLQHLGMSEKDDDYHEISMLSSSVTENDLKELEEEQLQQTDLTTDCTKINISTQNEFTLNKLVQEQDNQNILDKDDISLNNSSSENISDKDISNTNLNIERINTDVIMKKSLLPSNSVETNMKDIKQNVVLQINPDLSATKNFIRLLQTAEPLLNQQQKMCFCDNKFTANTLGISLPLLKPYSEDKTVRFINGHSRYISKPLTFNNEQWFLTNDIHKSNVNKLLDALNKMIKENINEVSRDS